MSFSFKGFIEGIAATLLGAVVVVFLLAGALLLIKLNAETKDWVVFIGLCVTSLCSAVSSLVGNITRRKQDRNAQELERFKAQFTAGLTYFNARLSQITVSEFEAYSLLWSALARFYRALYLLQTGHCDEDALKAAQKLCEEAEGHCLVVEEADRLTFYAFWQRSRYIWGEAEKRKGDPTALKQLWSAEIKGRPKDNIKGTPEVAGYYKELEEIRIQFYSKLERKVRIPAEQFEHLLQS